MPESFDVTVVLTPVLVFSATTDAPGTIAPDESVTVPVTVANVLCARAGAVISGQKHSASNIFVSFIAILLSLGEGVIHKIRAWKQFPVDYNTTMREIQNLRIATKKRLKM
jgi:hypothetical protein